jgi:hypothetical protein
MYEIKLFKYTVFWLDGKREVIEGESIGDAARRAGIQKGALASMDFYSDGEDDGWEWNADRRSWISKKPITAVSATASKE